MRIGLLAIIYFLLLLIKPAGVAAQEKYAWKDTTTAGYTFRYVANDPQKVRFYTLNNGLQVMLQVNHNEPRVIYKMVVRTGSNNDPADHTGLAHYLEHLLFKGTDKYGTVNWEKEKPYMDVIETLYETYNHTTDEQQRKKIYRSIDSVSQLASKYAIANEYLSIMKEMGSKGTNAHTETDGTVYDENVPSEAMDKLLKVQAERFRNPIFRLFHTELEAVYEEKNKGMDADQLKVLETISATLYPHSNYGKQTTIGTIEHLKNPSLTAIRNYYNERYVPDNMGIILCGDFNPDEVIKKVDEYFSYMKSAPVKEYKAESEPDFQSPVIKDIVSPTPENVVLAFRAPFRGAGSKDNALMQVLSQLLINGSAGLIDIDLIKKQQLEFAMVMPMPSLQQYGTVLSVAVPKSGQSLDEAKALLMQEIDKVKAGLFDESLLTGIKNNTELMMSMLEKDAMNTASSLESDFIADKCANWNHDAAFLTDIKAVTKDEVVEFAKRVFTNNYVCIYKKKGKSPAEKKIVKPRITPIQINKTDKSEFAGLISKMPVTATSPKWVNFDKSISKTKIGNAELLYVANRENGYFEVKFRLDVGRRNNDLLPVAVSYLELLGTNKYTAEQISKEFYLLACQYKIDVTNDHVTIALSGIQRNFEKALALLEHLLANCKPAAESLVQLKQSMNKSRADAKSSKEAIMQALVNYAAYGPRNPFNTQPDSVRISTITADALVDLLHQLSGYKQLITYYGPETLPVISRKIKSLHTMPAVFRAAPFVKPFQPLIQQENEVYVAAYDMVQTQIQWVRNIPGYDPSLQATIDLFNSYFGGGMGSVVFQQIRESKALAYSTYAKFQTPADKNDPYKMTAFVGCQADKMHEAIETMNGLFNDIPRSDEALKNSKASILKSIETQRITDDKLLDYYLSLEKLGLKVDVRKQVYEKLSKLEFEDLKAFGDKYLKAKKYAYCVLGSKDVVGDDTLKKYGKLKEIALKELFGY